MSLSEVQPQQTSNRSTAPANTRKAPRVHLKKTRSNTPGTLSTSESGQGKATQATPKSEGGQANNSNVTNANVEVATSEGEDGEIQSIW